MAFVNEPPAGLPFFCGVVLPTFGKKRTNFDRTGCAWHGISWMFGSIFALHGVWFGFLSLFFFGLNSTQRSLHGSKFSKQLLRPPLTQRFSSQLLRILNFSTSVLSFTTQPKILWVLVSSPPENPWVLCFGNLLLCHGSPVPGVHGYAAMAVPLGGNSLPLRSPRCHRHRASDRCTRRRRKTTCTTGWTTGGSGDPGRMAMDGEGEGISEEIWFFEQMVGLGWKDHLITFQCSVCLSLGYIFFGGDHYVFLGVSHPWVCGPCLQDTQQQIGDAPYQGPLLFRPPNKRRKTQGLEEFPVFCWGGDRLGYFSRWFGENMYIIWI